MTNPFERIMSGLLTAAAVVLALSFAHREFSSHPPSRTAIVKPPQKVDNWQHLLDAGIVIGDSNAPVKILEISDFECPFCKRFETAFRASQRQFGRSVALVYVHYPLPMHRFAMPAARAAECAHEQGKFAEFHDLIFDKQDSLGLKSWASFAHDADVPDVKAFERCNERTTPVLQVTKGETVARELDVHGTPTVIVNGWRFFVPPDDISLPQIVAAARAGDDSLAKFAAATQE